MTIETNKYLSELLPYDPSKKMNGNLKTSLTEYRLLIKAAKLALNAFQCGDLEKFDALLRENACQIRAVKVAMLYPKCLESIQPKLEKAEQKIEALFESMDSLMKKGISLKSLLEEEDFDVSLTSSELFLIESYLLCVAKDVLPAKPSAPLQRNEETNEKKLNEIEKTVSGGFVKNLVEKARLLSSAASVDFVREQAQFLEDSKLQKMCSEEFTVKFKKMPCVPMFWTYKTLLTSAQKKGVPLLITAKVKENDWESVFFKPGSSGQYEESVLSSEDLSKPAIVVEGAICADPLPSKEQWKAAIAAQNIGVILAGAADHRQYPDSKEDRIVEILNDQEFEEYKKMAKSKGYALENPSLFFIQHVYASTVKNIFQRKQ